MKTFNKVCVVGLGYIGLPTAAVIASRGIEVLGVDVSTYAVDTINQGKIHIVEPDLDMLVQAAVMTGVPISIVSTVVCSVSAEGVALFASCTPSWIWLKMSVRTITR